MLVSLVFIDAIDLGIAKVMHNQFQLFSDILKKKKKFRTFRDILES